MSPLRRPDRVATVNVDEQVLQRLRLAVLVRHGRLYGYLGLEATQAIEAHATRLLNRHE